ncbi:hypothetical protein [Haloarcula onubensis]|uniref:Uncharacterized protein n=1 Tax=Haloarcula onubensis TaxID=2950539 RepID=A0ABU2FS49_9EURY|nr:hypothetical protein [Halomicroarcula sp. S3CR25-11]MDS0283599.1 hypothetical protein [Halomicroarcula sp. S3CR25-11]
MVDPTLTRRRLLGTAAGAGAATLAGCPLFSPGADGTPTAVGPERARRLAAQFAPTLYFDEREQWFPTDPRPYTSQRDGETVVTGFDALDGYHDRFTGDLPPDPTVFYNAVEYRESPLAVVQFWFYSVFDQFTTNFHWHDWEVLHVFVDTADDSPQLYVASSHSRRVPNNEFLDPDPETRPRILAELGSHSSALSLNDEADRFQRLPEGNTFADITNRAVESLGDVAAIPLAYGLPRDEGSRLPYLLPEYEDAPLYDHPDLPTVERADFVPDDLVVRSFEAFAGSATDLPARETGLVFDHAARESGDADIGYDLVPTTDIEHITDFTGPQLSFEFAVPEAAEDAVSGHISTTGAPWGQPRYANPAADITEPNHRDTLADRYDAIGEAAPVNTVVATVSAAVPDPDAPDGDGVTTQQSGLEAVALLESAPEAVPTFGGVVAVTDVPAGDHRLTVNRAGAAPHSEGVSVADGDGPTVAGVAGEIPMVARDRARKIEVDPGDADSDLTAFAVEDDFGGRLYDAPLDGPDAVYVHEGGAYTAEVRDAADEVGAVRVNPDPTASGRVSIDSPDTGKASLATFLADIAAETRDQVADSEAAEDATGRENSVDGLTQALGAVVGAADRAAEEARTGNRATTDRQLELVASRLERVRTRLDEASDALSEPLSTAARKRLDQAERRTSQAREAQSL